MLARWQGSILSLQVVIYSNLISSVMINHVHSFIYLPATVYIKKELLNNRGNAARKPKEKPRGL